MKNVLWFNIINYIELNGVLSSPNKSPSPNKPLRQTKSQKKVKKRDFEKGLTLKSHAWTIRPITFKPRNSITLS